MRNGYLKDHHFITPLFCIESGAALDIMPADENVIMGVPHLTCRIMNSPLIVMIPKDSVRVTS